MSTYTERMQAVVARTNQRGNVDTVAINDIAAIIWEMDQRITALEEKTKVTPKKEKVKPIKTKTGVGVDDVATN